MGYDITTVTEVTVSKGKVLEVEKDIAKLSHVCAVYDVTGEEDSIVISKFKNREELSAFAKEVLAPYPHACRKDQHPRRAQHHQGRLSEPVHPRLDRMLAQVACAVVWY